MKRRLRTSSSVTNNSLNSTGLLSYLFKFHLLNIYYVSNSILRGRTGFLSKSSQPHSGRAGYRDKATDFIKCCTGNVLTTLQVLLQSTFF